MKLNTHPLIKKQPNWIKNFLKKIQLWQNNKKKALLEMAAITVKEKQGFLLIEIPLQQSEHYAKQFKAFQSGQLNQVSIFENEVRLCLWLRQETIKFSWEEIILSQNPSESILNILNQLIGKEHYNSKNLKEPYKFHLQVEGSCKTNEIRIIDSFFEMTSISNLNNKKTTINYNQFPKGLKHFIKEVIQFCDDWQQYFFPDMIEPNWRFKMDAPTDKILKSSFEEYAVKQYGEAYLSEYWPELPQLINAQLLKYGVGDFNKFKILEDGIMDYYDEYKRWPKDLLEVVIIYYKRNFIRGLNRFAEEFVFIAMRFYDCPFYPDAKSDDEIYKWLENSASSLWIGNYNEFETEFNEWKKWLD
jgi:hypothetical protein